MEVTAEGLKGRGSCRVRKGSSEGILELGQKPRKGSGAGNEVCLSERPSHPCGTHESMRSGKGRDLPTAAYRPGRAGTNT